MPTKKDATLKYRPILESLLKNPKYLKLSPNAKLCFFNLKLALGVSGIECLDPRNLETYTGLQVEDVNSALDELEDTDWIRREANIVWLIDGYKNETNHSLANDKHRTSLTTHLVGLPRLRIVDAFAERYGIQLPEDKKDEPPLPPRSTAATRAEPLKKEASEISLRLPEPEPAQPEPENEQVAPARAVEDKRTGSAEGRLMGLVRRHLYINKKEPEGWSAARDITIIREILKAGFSEEEIADAIEGVDLMRHNQGEKLSVNWIDKDSALTMRALYNSKSGVQQVFTMAVELARQNRRATAPALPALEALKAIRPGSKRT